MHLAQPHTTTITPGYEHPRWSRIRFNGAAPAADGTTTPPAGGTGTEVQQPTPPAPSPATVAAQQAKQESKDLWDDPAKAKAEIERLRAENAKDRTTAKQNAATEAKNGLIQELGKALGLVKDGDTTPTPEELTAQLAEKTSEATATQRELAVYRTAGQVPGADVNALLDSRTFLDSIKDIKPDDTAALKAAVEKAITDNPRLKTAQAAGKSGGDLTGGTGEGTVTAEQFKAMTPTEKNTLFTSNPTLYRQLAGR
ncbi:hypothetical protein ACFSYH_01965 [Populibacterium corticicola]|uniref:Scaffolding protein n=1 Tax=Populibacterium corticicola TaxID=1812826 RepID=A0ABW5XBT9_9MICO